MPSPSRDGPPPARRPLPGLAVVATFAMGAALGDFSATTLHLGYLASGFLFAAVIARKLGGIGE